MPRSMTGFGRGECIRYDRRFKVEIKSVNHRYNDITIKLPRFLNPFEDRIKKRLSAEIARGKVDVWINFESFTQKDVSVKINEAFADAYMGAMSDIVARYKLGDSIPAATGLELLVRNSDIISFDKFETAVNSDTAQTEMLEALDEALELALAQFSKMRKAEGDALAQDILEKQKLIMGLRAQLAEVACQGLLSLRQALGDVCPEFLERHTPVLVGVGEIEGIGRAGLSRQRPPRHHHDDGQCDKPLPRGAQP